MTLAPAPESRRKFSGFGDCETVARTQTSPSRNSNGNSANGTGPADKGEHAANRITEAVKRPNTPTGAAAYVPTTARLDPSLKNEGVLRGGFFDETWRLYFPNHRGQ